MFTYTLFGDRADGTYSQVDETHAHLNMPATFVFARGLDFRPIKIKFNVREDLRWKVATQLKPVSANTFYAPHLQYFMDSPTEISDFTLHEFEEVSNGKKYKIRIALHHTGTDEDARPLFEGTKKIVHQQNLAMGELPDYDYGTYTFLACYMPQASGDGMEHRNSTYCVGPFQPTAEKINWALGTISHEFFHCWNVERIRPATLEPFNFEEANMSGELWFAEGFTNYYGGLFMCRAGLTSQKDFITSIGSTVDYIENSPGRKFFNPIEMSYQAPFTDAATSIDPNNRNNTFISYYPYGEIIGLALDLTLRNVSPPKSLDEFMQTVWNKHGRAESPYTVRDIQTALTEYTNPAFASEFFNKYVHNSDLPDYKKLFESVGLQYAQENPGKSYWGAQIKNSNKGIYISSYTKIGTPAYKAGLESGDIITMIEGKAVENVDSLNNRISELTPGKIITVTFKRTNTERTARVVLEENPSMQLKLFEDVELKPSDEHVKRRNEWLMGK